MALALLLVALALALALGKMLLFSRLSGIMSLYQKPNLVQGPHLLPFKVLEHT
jgi:hypothetical protein